MDYIHSWSYGSMIIRLIVAIICGSMIGIDREIKNRGAGMKTHALVCLGSALAMMVSDYMYRIYPGELDLARIGAQVISGVGFLGVGTIIVTEKKQIKGLTTAAGLWVCACMGIAIGIGFVEGAVIAIILVLLCQKFLDKVDVELHKKALRFDIYIEFADNTGAHQLLEWMHTNNFEIRNFNVRQSRVGEAPVATFTVVFETSAQREDFRARMHTIPGQCYIDELY